MLHLDYFGCWLLEMAKKIEKDLLCALRDKDVLPSISTFIGMSHKRILLHKMKSAITKQMRERERKDNQQDLLKKS